MNGHGRHEDLEPRPPSFQPPIVIQERRNIWDTIRTFFRGCFILLLIFFFTPLLIILTPRIYEYFRNQYEDICNDFTSNTGLSSVWISRWFMAIVLGLIIGAIIRLLRRI